MFEAFFQGQNFSFIPIEDLCICPVKFICLAIIEKVESDMRPKTRALFDWGMKKWGIKNISFSLMCV